MGLTSSTKTEVNTYVLEISVGADELKAASDIVFKKKRGTIAVPGFRKGKAPRKVIERMYGEGVFLEDAVNDLYPDAYTAAVEEVGIEPVSRAEVEVLTLDINDGFTFKATVTVKPEVTVTDYKGIEAVKTVYFVEEEDIDKEVERIRDRNARIITVEDRPAQDGDQAVIDFEGFVDGEAFEGGKAEGHTLTLGSNSFIEGFESQIIGKSTGDEFDVNVTFPEEYHASELAGKPAVFKVKLHEIKLRELPELDDEFAKDISEFDTLEEYRADIRGKLEEAAGRRTADEYETLLVDKVAEGLEGEIPPIMIDTRIDGLLQDFSAQLQRQGMTLNLYLQYSGIDVQSFRKTFRSQAERQVKVRLALEKIAQVEELEITPEELEAEYERVAGIYEMEVSRVKEFIGDKDVTADLLSGKAIDLVRDSAKSEETTKPMSAPPPELAPVEAVAEENSDAQDLDEEVSDD